MTYDELVKILKKKISKKEMKDFFAGEIVRRPMACGCIKRSSGWYTYSRMDEYCQIFLHGPYSDSDIVYACARFFDKGELFEEYETDAFLKIYLHSNLTPEDQEKIINYN